ASAGAQRVHEVAVGAGTQPDGVRIPRQHLVPQAHRPLVRDERQDLLAPDHAAAPAGATWRRATSSASTKLPATPIITVVPIACSTGIEDSASSPNTSAVMAPQTAIACSVRSCSRRSLPVRSKNSA